MNKQDFLKLVDNILVLDGATGTELLKRGMPKGVCPEKWVYENPEIISELQREYFQAGSNAVYACTFGANRIKLSEFGLQDKVYELNKGLARISKKAAGKGLVAGDIAPTGEFIKPLGRFEFEEIVDIYKEQVKGLLDGGVDFFVIETMMDIQEARAALLAVKESCDLPVCVSMTFNEDGRTLTGTDPASAVVTLQSLGADVVGCNCSTGPEKMLNITRQMKQFAKVPLLAKPNAGLPKLVNGETIFDMKADQFSSFAESFIQLGVGVIGGCCGTTPNHINKLAGKVKEFKWVKTDNTYSVVSSLSKTVSLGNERPIAVVGERINPTGKKLLKQALMDKNFSYIMTLAQEQEELGADILDVNVGLHGTDEKELMQETVRRLASKTNAPLCIDSSSIETIEEALRIYPGRALINSISAEKVKIEKLLPIAAKYGAMFILLPLSDKGVPKTAEERIEIIKYIYEESKKYGFNKSDIVVDGLVMTVSSSQEAAVETLKVINWASNTFGVNTILGLSNVSFGLPQRDWINGAFIAMAAANGLSMTIGNPSSEVLMNMKRASDVLSCKDLGSREYIQHFTGKETQINQKTMDKEKPVSQLIFECVVKGDKDNIISLVEKALKEGKKPDVIVNEYLIPAINHVGDLFEEKKFFLPQLIQGAESMKTAFTFLEPMLGKADNDEDKEIRVVAATVKGDIHDIGKNIVVLMLKNHGFKVYDLGKDVSAEEIISKAMELKAKIICLSALMTTTMTEMKEVIELARKEKMEAKIMVGGAVVTKDYADQIGADGYSEDAQRAVKMAEKLTKNI